MLTTEEAAEILRESPITTMRRCARGDLPATKPGRRWLINAEDLEEYLRPSAGVVEREYITASQKRSAFRSADHKRRVLRDAR